MEGRAVTVRRARRDDDLGALDFSFTTDRVYDVVRTRTGFSLRERRVPRLRKSYDVPERRRGEVWLVAEVDGAVAGIAVFRHERWNNRAELVHLYVDRRARGRGAGTALVDDAVRLAHEAGARTLWLETQNVNLPAIAFYRRAGFRLVGLDETLYDPEQNPGEVALYFALELT